MKLFGLLRSPYQLLAQASRGNCESDEYFGNPSIRKLRVLSLDSTLSSGPSLVWSGHRGLAFHLEFASTTPEKYHVNLGCSLFTHDLVRDVVPDTVRNIGYRFESNQ